LTAFSEVHNISRCPSNSKDTPFGGCITLAYRRKLLSGGKATPQRKSGREE
jgi:hypothetical protein